MLIDRNADVSRHYTVSGLLAAIEDGMVALGKSSSTVTLEELGAVDEFHIGGRRVTAAICERIGVSAQSHVLDVGCGIGGAARFIASSTGCNVTGIDLTPAYIEVARALTDWVGLSTQVGYETANALDMPFPDDQFDHAIQLHVGMNIADKVALFSEVRRVLRPGGRFTVYDIVRVNDDEISFPVPWATEASTSMLSDLPGYRNALQAAGFEIVDERDHTETGLEVFAAARAQTATLGEPPPLGIHLMLGVDAPLKISNLVGSVSAGTLAPMEILCH